MLNLFNRLVSKGEYPRWFGEGVICPIFKVGDIEDAKNFRGITLINILSKIFYYIKQIN